MKNTPAPVPSTETALVPVFAGEINGSPAQLVNARDLHAFLQSGRDFSHWIKARITKYKFRENDDYLLAKFGEQLPSGTKYRTDYHLTLDMAKELSMVENNEKGQQARRYFIDMERQALAAALRPNAIKELPPAGFRPEKSRIAHPGGLTLDQQDSLKTLIRTRVEALPPVTWKSNTRKLWSALKTKFGVEYKHIPASEFAAALSLVARVPLAGTGQALLPLDDLDPGLRAAASRKAHALAMDGYDRIRERLEQRLREQAAYQSPDDLRAWLDRIGGPDAELVIIGAHELWHLTTAVKTAQIGIAGAMAAIDDLEASTARPWYARRAAA
jgi:phage anti-repressor protein